MARSATGRELFEQLDDLKRRELARHDLQEPSVKAVENRLSMVLSERRDRYFEQFRFIAKPELPRGMSGTGPLVVAPVAFMMGLFLMSLISLIRAWWRDSQEEVTSVTGSASPTG